MADIQVPPAVGTSGQRLDANVINALSTVYRQIISIGDPATQANVANVNAAGGLQMAMTSGVVTLSSTPLVVVASSGGPSLVTFTSHPMVVVATSGSPFSVTATGPFSFSSTPVVQTASSSLFSLTSTPMVQTASSSLFALTSAPLVIVATSGGQLTVTATGPISFSSTPLVQTASSSLFALTSAPLVIVATSGGQLTVTATGPVSFSSTPLIQTASSSLVALTSAPLVIVASSGGPLFVDVTGGQLIQEYNFTVSSSNSITAITTVATRLLGWGFGSTFASPVSIRIYNLTTASVNVASTIGHRETIYLPASTGAAGSNNYFFMPTGRAYGTAITISVVSGFASTGVASGWNAGDINGFILFSN